MTTSALYEGTIRHRRFAVRTHEFRHRLVLIYADLDELPTLLGGRLVRRRPGLVRFRRRDYLNGSSPGAGSPEASSPGAGSPEASSPDAPVLSLADAVRSIVRERLGVAPGGPIRVLTQPRTFGHCFNPVSFYYCFGVDERLEAVVAEVTSTPWGERHAYVLAGSGDGPVLRDRFDKQLHVSPFMGMDQEYLWRASTPGPTLSVYVESLEAGQRAFDATLSLRRRSLTRPTLARVTARYPAATVRVLALIYAHALALKLKGVPVHRRPPSEAMV